MTEFRTVTSLGREYKLGFYFARDSVVYNNNLIMKTKNHTYD